MAKKRMFKDNKATHFSEKHRDLMNGVYMTDIDSMQIVDMENQVYNQYTYINSMPYCRRIVEVKHRKTKMMEAVIQGEPNAILQTSMQVQAVTAAELSAFRRQNNMPEVDYWILFQDNGEYPYEIWKCYAESKTGVIKFEYQSTVYDDVQYRYQFAVD
jgi:hypothetical protein